MQPKSDLGRLWDAIEHERQLRELSEEATKEALRLQATEYERRLEDLNNAHARAEVERARTVPLDRFERYVEDNRERVRLALETTETKSGAELTALKAEVRILSDLIKSAQGAVNTWRFLAGFLGVGGIAAIVWALVQGGRP